MLANLSDRSVDYSIVVPVYFNEGSLKYTSERIFLEVFQKTENLRGEIVFVDDGSQDGSFTELKEISSQHPKDVRVIRLSRNFGQVNAIWCGLQNTSGPCVVISADGQDPIGLICEMLRLHFSGGKELVIATRATRDEGLWRKFTSALVYGAIRRLGNGEMPDGGFDFLLIGKAAKKELISNWQPNTFFQIRILQLGFSRAFLPYHREARKAGCSRWTFSKKMTYMIDGVLGHSYSPIRLMSVLGLIFSGVSFIMALFFFVAYFFNPNVVRGWTPIVLIVLFCGGVQMLMVGILGEYLWRILAQVRRDPPYIIEEQLGNA